jgi:phytoene dehydrogenase-like protein
VVDKHSVVGGNMSSFRHRGYEFDVGVHYIGGCQAGGQITRVLEPLGIAPVFRPLDPSGYDTIALPDFEFHVPAGRDHYRCNLLERFPAERAGIDRYLDVISRVAFALDALELRPSVADLPHLPRHLAPLTRHGRHPLAHLFDRLDLSPTLRAVLAGASGDYALPPSRASLAVHAAVSMHYMDGAWYPQGGSQVISEALAQVVRDHGGEILLQTPATGIEVSRGRVTGVRVRPPSPRRRQGAPSAIRAPVVISNTDLKRTYLGLVPPHALPARLCRRVARMTMAPPVFVLFLVLDRDLAAEGFRNTNTWVHACADAEAPYEAALRGRFADRPSVFISPGSLKDPGNARLCRPGQTNLQLATVVPGDARFWGINDGEGATRGGYRRNDAYLARKRQVRDAVIGEAERIIPVLRDSIAFEEAATPMTHTRFTGSTGGTGYGLAATPDQFLHRRPLPNTPLEGLYLVGANTVFGHGVAGVLNGGRRTAALVLGCRVDDLPQRTVQANRSGSRAGAS